VTMRMDIDACTLVPRITIICMNHDSLSSLPFFPSHYIPFCLCNNCPSHTHPFATGTSVHLKSSNDSFAIRAEVLSRSILGREFRPHRGDVVSAEHSSVATVPFSTKPEAVTVTLM